MRRNRGSAAGGEQSVEAAHEAPPDLVEPLEGDRRGLDVDSFAKPNTRTERRERRDVRLRAAQRRLQHDPDRVVAVSPEPAVEVERLVRGARVLHVDADEDAARLGVEHEVRDERAAQRRVELEPEARELDRDVRVEPIGVDRRERLVVGAGEGPGLVRSRDLLAQHVDRGS